MVIKVSFIIPAHNEEKMIDKSLGALLKLNYTDMEITICLDGCADDTESVINSTITKYNILNKQIKIIKNSERMGKAATIMKLLKASTGKIIILNDAEWEFKATHEEFLKLINSFDDPKIGGVHIGTTYHTYKSGAQTIINAIN